MLKKKLFLASSSELSEDRKAFEISIGRKNDGWVDQGVYLDLVIWEDFLDAMSRTRLQDEYNRAIRDCDIFVMLFFTKVGQYTAEEFETAFGQFKATGKPFIFTYFKDAEISKGSDSTSLRAFQEKLDGLGHFYTRYKNTEELLLKFGGQLDKLAANGFIELRPERDGGGDSHQADGAAVAQGPGAQAAGAGSVLIGGNNAGNINTGKQINVNVEKRIDTGGGAYIGGNASVSGGNFIGRDQIVHGLAPADWERLFAPLLEVVRQQAAAGPKAVDAAQKAAELKAEIAKGPQADDSRLAKIVDGLAALVPGAAGALVKLFAAPILAVAAGPVTKYVLEKLQAE